MNDPTPSAGTRDPFAPDVVARFWSYVRKGDGCWPWSPVHRASGYGYFHFHNKRVRAHRYAYELLVGPIPDGLVLDHLCRNRACVNPSHLEPVTLGTNVLRGEGPAAVNARRTHCVEGHALTEENTRITKRGRRDCRACSRKRVAAYFAANGRPRYTCPICGSSQTHLSRHMRRKHPDEVPPAKPGSTTPEEERDG